MKPVLVSALLVGSIMVSILVFSGIYYSAPEAAFFSNSNGKPAKMSYTDALMLSVSTQTLLGHDDRVAIQPAGQWPVMIQSMLTMCLIVVGVPLIFNHGGEKKT